jgi:hypothetical protein
LWVAKSYGDGEYVVFNDILYKANQLVSSDDVPGISDNWDRIYSFVPDTDFIYGPNSNSIIKIGDAYYYSKYNPDLTLDSGITIYINKKWKNVLVNISINDNTILSDKLTQDSTKNIERDNLYIQTNGRLTAANFIRQINDLDTLYGFVDWTSYVIIEEDGSFKKYNFKSGLDELPYMLIVEEPDEVKVRLDSLNYSINTVDKNILKPTRFLKDGNIDSLDKIDFYNDNPLGVDIQNIKDDPKVLKNYNEFDDSEDGIFESLYRFSGYYMPIFYDVELFTNSSLYQRDFLCDVQLVVSIDGITNVSLEILFGEVSETISLTLNPPTSDDLSGWEEFYNQIITSIQSSQVLDGVELFIDVYEPGDNRIHPQIEEGYYVLSVKYKSDVCGLKLVVKEDSPVELETFCALIGLPENISEFSGISDGILEFFESGIVDGKKLFSGYVGVFEYKIEWNSTENRWELYLFDFEDIESDPTLLAYLNLDIDVPLSDGWVISELFDIPYLQTYKNGCQGLCLNITISEGEDDKVEITTFNIQFVVTSTIENGNPVYFSIVEGFLKVRWDGEKWILSIGGEFTFFDIAESDSLDGDWMFLPYELENVNIISVTSSIGLCPVNIPFIDEDDDEEDDEESLS